MPERSTIEINTRAGKSYKLDTYPGASYTVTEFEAYLLSATDESMIKLNLLGGGSATINKLQITGCEQVPIPKA